MRGRRSGLILTLMRKPAFNFARYAQLVFWVVLFLFLLFSSVGAGARRPLIAAGLLLLCHLLNFYTIFAWLTPRYFEQHRYAGFFAGLLLLLLLLTPFRLWVESRFVYRPFLLLRGRRLSGLVLFSEISMAAFAFLLRMAIDNFSSRRRADQLEKGQLEAELKFLKSQMSPHFLFNTINNLYALALLGSEKTPEALLRLSELLRYLLYECHLPVPLGKELTAIRSYIALLQLRYEEPLNIQVENRVTTTGMTIEPMLLVPLLENAFKHSGIGMAPDAFIRVELREEAGKLLGHFVNSTLADDHFMDGHPGGIGLQNIRKRLEVLQPVRPEENLVILEHGDAFEVFIKIHANGN